MLFRDIRFRGIRFRGIRFRDIRFRDIRFRDTRFRDTRLFCKPIFPDEVDFSYWIVTNFFFKKISFV